MKFSLFFLFRFIVFMIFFCKLVIPSMVDDPKKKRTGQILGPGRQEETGRQS